MIRVIHSETTNTTVTRATLEIPNEQFYKGLWIACQRVRGAAATSLLLWLLSKLDADASFVYNKELVEAFNEEMKTHLGYEYKKFTIEDGLRELVRVKAVIRIAHARYQLQPWVTTGQQIPEAEEPKARKSEAPGLTPAAGPTTIGTGPFTGRSIWED